MLDRLNAFLAEGTVPRADPPPNPRRRPVSVKPKKSGKNISWRYTPAQAVEAGFLWATVGPKGNIVSVHRSEETGRGYVRCLGLRKAGCVVKRIEDLL